MLSIAAREADIVSLNVLTTRDGWLDVSTLTAEATLQKVGWVRQAAGSRFDSLELGNLILHTEVTEDRRQAAAALLESWKLPKEALNLDQVLESPAFLIGSIDQIIDDLQMRREKFGLSYFAVYEPLEALAQVVARLSGT
jgi:hypothetical protein